MLRDIIDLRGRIVSVGTPVLVSHAMRILWGLFSILIIRALPRDAFAAYAVARSIELIAVMLGGGFVMQAITKYAAEGDGPRENRLANAGILFALLLAVAFGAAITVFGGVLRSFYSDIDLEGIPAAIALLVITSTTATLPHSILRAKGRMTLMMFADLSSILLRIGIVLAFLLSDSLDSPLQIFGAMIAGNVLGTVVGGILSWRFVDPSVGLDRRELSAVFGFSVITLGASLAGKVYSRTDILILGKMSTETEVSGYSACRTLTALVDNLNMAAKTVMLPLVSRMWAKGRGSEVIRRTMSSILLISLLQLPVVIAFAGFPRQVLGLAFEGKYDGAAPVLVILGLLMVVKPVGSMFSSLSVAIGKPSYSFYSILSSALLNVVLNIVLVPRYGAIGAAWATVAAVLVGTAVVVHLSIKAVRMNLPA